MIKHMSFVQSLRSKVLILQIVSIPFLVECDLLVVNSVAHLTPSVEIEQSSEKWQVGVHARLMNKAMRKWVSAQNAVGMTKVVHSTILLINQIRHKIRVIYGSPETS